jgi:hypothetical protein
MISGLSLIGPIPRANRVFAFSIGCFVSFEIPVVVEVVILSARVYAGEGSQFGMIRNRQQRSHSAK